MKIVVAGDFCPMYRVAAKIEDRAYSFVLGDIKPIIEQADYSIINLECPVCSGSETPIDKCGPNLSCDEKSVEAIKWAGFNCVTLANNHFLDYGENGVKNTLDACKKYDIDIVGGGNNLKEASQILYKIINGQTVAVINCCEHEFSIATERTGGSNPLNAIRQYYAIREAREHADYVLVIVHGGNEHYQLPSPRMQETYKFFVDAGADSVVNHHQHCYSGYERYKGKPIFYGLGNFCFDSMDNKNSIWNQGYLVQLSFEEKIGFELYPYSQCDKTPQVLKCEKNIYDETLKKLNKIILDEKELGEKYNEFIDCSSRLNSVFAPYTNRILNALCHRNFLPSFMSRNKRRLMLAYIQCESHLPKVLKYLAR